MTIYRHSLYTFELLKEGKVLLFKWSDKTEDMNEEDYQEALHNYAGFGAELKVPFMLVDIRNFKYKMTPELGIWRDEIISPRYRKFGLKKFGYIVPKGVLEKMKDSMVKLERGFDEQYFETEDEVLNWFGL